MYLESPMRMFSRDKCTVASLLLLLKGRIELFSLRGGRFYAWIWDPGIQIQAPGQLVWA